MTTVDWALKEWAIAVAALLAGDLLLLIRKGGIRESRPVFEVPSDRSLLFPTYEHQSAGAVRSPYRESLVERPGPRPGDPLRLQGWAEITHQVALTGPDIVAALHPYHIWTDDWLAARLAWQPERPAYALLLRVHRCLQPVDLAYQARYGGCRSWMALQPPLALPDSTPVLDDATYQMRVAQLQAVLKTVTTPSRR